jgi:small-conductance mechanosensitive channel
VRRCVDFNEGTDNDLNETADVDLGTTILAIEHVGDTAAIGWQERAAALSDLPAEYSTFLATLQNASISPLFLVVQILLLILLASISFAWASFHFSKRWGANNLVGAVISVFGAAVIAGALGWVVSWAFTSAGLPVRTLRLWTVGTVAGCVLVFLFRSLVAPRHPITEYRSRRLSTLWRDISVGIVWAVVGIMLVATLQLWGAGPGLKDLARTFISSIPAYLLIGLGVWRHRRTIAAAVAGPRPRPRFRSRLARTWPGVVVALLIITFLSTQAALTMGAPLPGFAVLLTGLIAVGAPHLDVSVKAWAVRGTETRSVSVLAAAARQTARFAMLIVTVSMLGTLWATPLAMGLGIRLRNVAHDSFEIALIALSTAFLWNIIGVATERAMFPERLARSPTEVATTGPYSRLGTIVPLLSGIAKASIFSVALLSIMVSAGVNVWPLITGLSVFGLAVGFGSQTLVKDVVSGLFFLIDDAFRFGEYIETSGAKGTVEKISIRSVSLRNSRGSIATIPYGQIGKIENFSRDWAIDKITFRVAFDTDVELVRKLFKKIGEDIAADPEFSRDLIEPFKSKGISAVEDQTLVIKAQFTSRPGKQGAIRRAALSAVHAAFVANGIHATPTAPATDPVAQVGV